MSDTTREPDTDAPPAAAAAGARAARPGLATGAEASVAETPDSAAAGAAETAPGTAASLGKALDAAVAGLDASAASPHRPAAGVGTIREDAAANLAALLHDAAAPFGPTVFDAAREAPAEAARRRTAFDACHVGVVLRTLVFVHAVVAIGLLLVAPDVAQWLALSASAVGATLPAVLLWLVLACAARQSLAATGAAGQALAAASLGAFCAVIGTTPAWFLAGEPPGALHWVGVTLAGAGLALAVAQWLQLRGEAALPAATAARLAELQSRIRPHFLFNTLNTALALVRLDPARAEAVLEDLAELFRVAISDAGATTTLADEVDLARRYIAIEQIRFGSRLVVSWDIDAAAGLAKLPPLLLQPLVENAVRHGVEPSAAGGVLRVRTRVRQGQAVLSVANSVPALPSVPGNGVALRNVRERLRLMHDVSASCEVRHEPGVFRVEVVVPLESG